MKIGEFLGLQDATVAPTVQNGDCLYDSFRIALNSVGLKQDVDSLRQVVAERVYTAENYETDPSFREYLDNIKGMYESALIKSDRDEQDYYQFIAQASRFLPVSSTMKDYIADFEKMVEAEVIPARRKLIESDLATLRHACECTKVDIPRAMEALARSVTMTKTWGDEIAIHAILENLRVTQPVPIVLYTIQEAPGGFTSTQITPKGLDATKIEQSNCVFFLYTGRHYRPISSGGRFVFSVTKFPARSA